MPQFLLVGLLFSTLFGAAVVDSSSPEAEPTVVREAWVMGTRARISVVGGDRGTALHRAEELLRSLEESERILSTWASDSEMSQLNRAPVGKQVYPSPVLAGWLASAGVWAARTRGAFDPRLGAAIDAWGFRDAPVVPSTQERGRAVAASGPHAIEIAEDGSWLRRLDARAWLDTGAFGKGAALARIRDSWDPERDPHLVVDLGGQLWVSPAGSTTVAIAHPRDRDEPLLLVTLSGESIATSGQSERTIDIGGREFGHVLDPRTGGPVPAWGSVSVVSTDPLEADALSTALLVMGPDQGSAWAERHGVAALFLVVNGDEIRRQATPAWHARRHKAPARTNPSLPLHPSDRPTHR